MAAFRSKSARRRDASPTDLKNLLAGNSSLAALQQHAISVAKLKNALWPFLPPSLRPHCELANYRDYTLYLHANSPLWAAKARHASPQILHAARQRCKISVRKLVVRIRPAAVENREDRRPKQVIGSVSRHLKQAADWIDDPELAVIMRRIARRGPSEP